MSIRHVTIFECDACGFRRDADGQFARVDGLNSITFYDEGDESQRPVSLLLCAACTKKVKAALISTLGSVVETKLAESKLKPVRPVPGGGK